MTICFQMTTHWCGWRHHAWAKYIRQATGRRRLLREADDKFRNEPDRIAALDTTTQVATTIIISWLHPICWTFRGSACIQVCRLAAGDGCTQSKSHFEAVREKFGPMYQLHACCWAKGQQSTVSIPQHSVQRYRSTTRQLRAAKPRIDHKTNDITRGLLHCLRSAAHPPDFIHGWLQAPHSFCCVQEYPPGGVRSLQVVVTVATLVIKAFWVVQKPQVCAQ